jgi:FixJ family two-component response regulator
MISVIDDDETVRKATKSLLRSLGYGAEAFASAKDFLESDHVHSSSCLISDVQMPGMSGLELQSLLIAEGHRLPVIFITAYPEAKARARALKAGALGFLSKPVSEEDVIACLTEAFKDRRFEA